MAFAAAALAFTISLSMAAVPVRAQELGPMVGAVIAGGSNGGVVGSNWSSDTSVTVEVFDGPDAATATSLGTWIGYPAGPEADWWFGVSFEFPLEPGWLVQLTGADSQLRVATVVTDLAVSGWDPASGVVSGTTSDPSRVSVHLFSPPAAVRNAEMWLDTTGLWHWSADFSRPANVEEGELGDPVVLDAATTSGQAIQNLDESGGTLVHFPGDGSDSVADGSLEPGPSVGALITSGEESDSVVGQGWSSDGSVTVEVFDGPTSATATSLGTWVGDPAGLEVNWWFGVDLDLLLQPGWLVQLTGVDSGLIVATVVTDLVVTGWDPASGKVTGTTSDPSSVSVDLQSPAASWRVADMSQDATGLWHWTADFSRLPNPVDGEWGDPVVLELATTRGQAIQNLDQSGGTLVHFGSQADDGGGSQELSPSIGAIITSGEESDTVVGGGWSADASVTVEVFDGPDAATATSLGTWIGYPAGPEVDWSFTLNLDFFLQPGWLIRLTGADSGLTVATVVTDLVVTGWDPASGIVSGTTSDPSPVSVDLEFPGASWRVAEMSQDATGLWHWTADFSRLPNPADDEWGDPVALDLETTRGQAIQNPDESGGTLVHFFSKEGAPLDQPDADGPPEQGEGGVGETAEVSDDRGRGIDGAVSLLDDIVLELFPDDADRQALVADGTIGDLFRHLREQDQVKQVTDAIKELVKGPALVDRTVDLEGDDDITIEVDEATGEERRVVIVSSASNDVTVRVPVRAIERSGQFVTVTVEPIEDLGVFSASVPLPSTSRDTSDQSGTPIVTGVYVELNDENGEPLTEFDEALTITLRVDPATTNLDSVVVVSFDDRVASWAPIAATVSAGGVVEFSVDHLTLFALLRLARVTHTLTTGLNSVTFTGPSGTLPDIIAARIGSSLENLLTFDATTQSFHSYIPGASATFNTLHALSQREALFVRVASPVTWTETEIIASASGSRTVALMPGLNAIGFTGPDGTDPAEIASANAGIESIFRLDVATQEWLTYVPGAPALLNTLTSVGRLDVFFVRYSGSSGTMQLPEVGGQ